MIKSFEQFINENYNEKTAVALNEEYGAPLFNEISESLMFEINESINEGRLVLDANMIEEGLFDTIGKLFKKGADKSAEKVADAEKDETIIRDFMPRHATNKNLDSTDFEQLAKDLGVSERDQKVYNKIEELCKSAEETCAKLAEKEEEMYKKISEKLTAANEAIQEFTKSCVEKIKNIVETSKNKLSDVIATVLLFAKRLFDFAKKAMEKLGQGVVLAFVLPIMFVYSLYKGAVKVCGVLVEKVKDGAKFVKETFGKVKETITNWISETLVKAKEIIKNACDAIKDGAKSAYNAIAKTYLAIVGVLGQLISDVKDSISEAYNKFVDGVKDLSDDVKDYVSEKWDAVSNWCKKTSTAFAEGVKNVWKKTKEKVMGVVGSISDAYDTLKKNANATWDEIKSWNDDRIQSDIKAKMKYAADKWGKDTVSSWVDEL